MSARGTLLLLAALCGIDCAALEVYSTEPGDGAKDVNPEAALQFYVDEKFDARTVTRDAIALLDGNGSAVDVVLTPDLGGAVTVAPAKALKPNSRYTLRVNAKFKSAGGKSVKPFDATFWTGDVRKENFEHEPRLRKARVDEGEGYVSCAVGPDGNLYITTWTGQLWRLVLDAQSGHSKKREKVYENPGLRLMGLCFDPKATAERAVLWMTADDNPGESSSSGKFSSRVLRLTLNEKGKLKETETILSGLPNGAHPLTSCVFGPDGKLYLAQGSMTHLGGGEAGLAETPLSAAVLVADVNGADFGGVRLPVDCSTAAPRAYDPTRAEAPLKVYASGVREAFDLCWHSNGQMYAAINMNDTMAATPGRAGLAALRNVQPDEPLVRIVAGKHYGHPNPALGKYVLMGGNPGEGVDPWEVYRYPAGTQPDAGFDPSLFIFNLAPLGGPSANGCCEATAEGPLKGRLLICFYTTARTLHSFTLSSDGAQVTGSAPLVGEDGKALKFGAPLDVAQHPSGRLYVVDFQDERRGDSGRSGGVWMLEPAR